MIAVTSLSHATAMEDPLHDAIKAGDLALGKEIISNGAERKDPNEEPTAHPAGHQNI